VSWLHVFDPAACIGVRRATNRQFGCGSLGISADWDASPDRQVSVPLSRGTIAMSAGRCSRDTTGPV